MLRFEIIFFAVAMAASLCAMLLAEGGTAWMAAKVVFLAAFLAFAGKLISRQLGERSSGRHGRHGRPAHGSGRIR